MNQQKCKRELLRFPCLFLRPDAGFGLDQLLNLDMATVLFLDILLPVLIAQAMRHLREIFLRECLSAIDAIHDPV